ncbi:MAG: hypothetical protein QXK06_00980 [Candidatus Diapherotrites archaeon]
MHKKNFAWLAFLFLLGSAFAQQEVSLKGLGYKSLEANGIEAENCSEFFFSIPDPGKEFYPIISIKAEFYPSPEGLAGASAELNGENIGRFEAKDFKCSEKGCWARIELERAKFLKENKLWLCIKTGRSVTRAVLSNESLIGYYKKPIFIPEEFKACVLLDSGECVESYNATLGEDLNIILSITNKGSDFAYLDLRSRKEMAGITTARKEIGQTSFAGIIAPGEKKILSYTVRVENAVPMHLPPAYAKYSNVFGEEEIIKSNLVFINPAEEPRLTTTIGIESVKNQPREAYLVVTIFNREKIPVSNAKIRLETENGLEIVEGSQSMEIPSLEPKQAKSFTLKAIAQTQGKFQINCTFSADGLKEKPCEPATVFFREENPVLLAGITILLLAGGGAIYIYLHTRKEYGR